MMQSLTSHLVLENWQIVLCVGVILVAISSAFAYWRQSKRINAALIVAAGLCFCMMIVEPSLPLKANPMLIDGRQSQQHMAQLLQQSQSADSYLVRGDGLRWAQWQDLPRLPIRIESTDVSKQGSVQAVEVLAPVIELDFPTQITQGRIFHLSVQRQHVDGEWRLQLLAENQQVLAETRGRDKRLSLQWLPPAAERLVLQAKILDQQGRVLEQGPIPLEVIAAQNLLVQGRFAAPSFDSKVLNTMLSQSQAKLDWQTKLGKTVTRIETAQTETAEQSNSIANADTSNPDLFVQDAAYFEQQNPRARAQVLQQVAAGGSLLILGANASDTALWRRELGLRLQAADTAKEVVIDPLMTLHPSAWTPQVKSDAYWVQPTAQTWMAQRAWGQGQIVWLGAADWHRYQISATNSLQAWWQSILDQAQVKKRAEWEVRTEPKMPIVGQHLRFCGQGLQQATLVFPLLNKRMPLQAVRDQADARCAAFWPEKSAWLDWQAVATRPESEDSKDATVTPAGAIYVYQPQDWPAWQRAQARADTKAMQALAPIDTPNAKPLPQPLATWPWALGLILALLLLWWREQKNY